MISDRFYASKRNDLDIRYPNPGNFEIKTGAICLGPISRQLPSLGYLFANLDDIRRQMARDYNLDTDTCTFTYPRSAKTCRVMTVVAGDDLRRNQNACMEHVVKTIVKKYDEVMARRYFNMDSNRFQKFIDGVRLVGGSVDATWDGTDGEIMKIVITDPFHSLDRVLAGMNCGTPQKSINPPSKPVTLLPGVSDIQFYNDRVTVVRFADGTFTKCVADVDENGKSCFDPYTGVAFCLFKRMLGKEDGHKKFNNLMRKVMGVMDAKKKALEEQEKMKVERLCKEIRKNNKKVRRAAENREAFIEDIAEAVRRAQPTKEVSKDENR